MRIWTPLRRLDDLEAARRAARRDVSESTLRLALISLIYPLYYLGVSWAISVIHWRKQWLRRQKRA